MAFFDKLGDIAKNIGDKTNDAIETSKLNSKINSEKSAINEVMKKIGEFYYAKWQQDTVLDAQAAAFCQEIDEHNKVIADAQAEIEKIKAESQAPPPMAGSACEPAQANARICAACGAQVPEGIKFCGECGTKFE